MSRLSPAAQLRSALPFALSLALVPVILFAATRGGWTLSLPIIATWFLFTTLDALFGMETANMDPETADDQLFWHRLITIVWFPIQFVLVFGLIWYVTHTDHLNTFEKIVLFFGVGIMTGAIGIVYSHELMHQKNRMERWLGDLLLANVLYSHFRSEHLLVHHRYVGTPKDPVSARYGETFHHFFFRVLHQCFASAWNTEKAMLARKKLPVSDFSNPFWRYATLQIGFLIFAYILGGWAGFGLFLLQAAVAIWHLELTNYVEHYGLTRKHLGNGKYEHAQPRHSWNAAHKVSNWFLINLQRHSDHHYKPDRRYPLLQNYGVADAPQLPVGYAGMVFLAVVPPLFFRVMNPRVRKWRGMYYPEITDWEPYKNGTNPMPR